MLDRIEIGVIDVPFEIAAVADRVLPEAALPERMFSIGLPGNRAAGLGNGAGEMAPDQPLPVGEAGIACRQRHGDMEMIRTGACGKVCPRLSLALQPG